MKALNTVAVLALFMLIGQASLAQSNSISSRYQEAVGTNKWEANVNAAQSQQARIRVDRNMDKLIAKQVQFRSKAEGDAIRSRRAAEVKATNPREQRQREIDSKTNK